MTHYDISPEGVPVARPDRPDWFDGWVEPFLKSWCGFDLAPLSAEGREMAFDNLFRGWDFYTARGADYASAISRTFDDMVAQAKGRGGNG